MEASLSPQWWQKFRLLVALGVCGVLVVAAYLFDPPVLQPAALAGEVVSTVVVEHPKTGFRQVALVKLSSGQVVRAAASSARGGAIPAGTKVTVHEFISLAFQKRSYRVEITE